MNAPGPLYMLLMYCIKKKLVGFGFCFFFKKCVHFYKMQFIKVNTIFKNTAEIIESFTVIFKFVDEFSVDR